MQLELASVHQHSRFENKHGTSEVQTNLIQGVWKIFPNLYTLQMQVQVILARPVMLFQILLLLAIVRLQMGDIY